MAQIDLTKYGITGTTEIVYNPSYEQLFEEETKPELEGYEKGRETELGAVNVMTGIYTGRSPKDKYIVVDENSKDTVWWTSDEYKNDNHPATQEAWAAVKEIAKKELSNKRLFVVDAFCGANKDTRMAIRFIVEVAWQAHFVTNMFIKPTAEELENFEPDFVVYNASKAKVENYKELGLNSETAVVFNITSREQVIVNTWYGGEMKKGMFSMMNYYLPLKGIASMHCSANTDLNGENTAIFFGLSGTGKTTLSTDPKRLLIGDDEHGWDDNAAIAKIAGLKMCESFNLQYGTNYIAVMPTNLYGPNDNFHLENSHVLPAMIRKIHLAKCLNEGDWDAVRKDINLRPVEGVNGSNTDEEILEKLAKFGITPEAVTLWGTGKPMREFLWSEEMADASVHVLLNVDFKQTYDASKKNADGITEIRNCHINVGTGKEVSIREVAEKIMKEIGFKGELRWDASKPDGTLRKLTDVSKLHSLGWHHKVEIDEGIHRLYEWYLKGICINHQTV